MDPKTINISNISALPPKMINKNSFKFCTIPLEMNTGEPLTLKFSARLKIFKHSANGNDSYSLGITIPEDLLETMKKIETRINALAFSKKQEVRTLNSNFGNFQTGNFHLIKEDLSGFPKIYAKLYADRLNPKQSSGAFFRVIEEDGKKMKQRIKNNLELVGIPLDGIVVLNLKQIFCGNIKALTSVAKEVLVEKEIHPISAFDEYEDMKLALSETI